jgi:3-deoxy-manno-octulosonate cytidylyltransferase (CMP-KDO synthetase)
MRETLPTFVGIIPARYGSSRFPGKPLALISGKSLIQRTYENAKRFKELCEVVVATDDERIFSHVESFGGKAVHTSADCPTGTDRLAEVVRNKPEYQQIDYFFNLQGDEPLVDPSVISKICILMQDDKEAVMGTAVVPLSSKKEAMRPSVVKCVMDLKQNALHFSRSLIPVTQSGEFNPRHTYYRHIGIYCYTRELLLHYAELPATPLQEMEQLEQLKLLEHGYRIKVAVVQENTISPAVDYPEDIKNVEQVLCNLNSFL